MLLLALIAALILLSIIYISSYKKLDFWKKKGVKYLDPLPLVGNMLPTITCSVSMSEFVANLYNSFPTERYIGFYKFGNPVLLIKDPELIKSVTIKNFEHFQDHTGLISGEIDPLWGKNLFASQGERWRDLRQTMSPLFTSSKMRSMFVLMDECVQQLRNYFVNKEEVIQVDWKTIAAKYTNDVIASAAFGIKCDSFKESNNEFLLRGEELADFSGLKKLNILLFGQYPRLAKVFGFKMISDTVGNFFRQIINQSIALREEKKIIRPDLINLLMLSRKGKLKYEDYMNLPEAGFASTELELNRLNYNPNYLTNEDITAQAIVFFLGGYDTVASLLSFTTYELAVNPTIQKKLRSEVAKTHEAFPEAITYEGLVEMKYLDMVISEAARKWPQATWLDRKCTKAFEIEPTTPDESPLKVNVGDVLWIPVYALHRDPSYFPHPDVFDPERFSPENVANIQFGTYIPFGIGPRNCIGSRFALLEIKILLYYLLLDFEFVPTEETQIPLKLRKDTAALLPEKRFYLGLKRSPLIASKLN